MADMTRLISIWLAVMSVASPSANPADVAAFSAAVAHVSRIGVDPADLIALAWIETGKTFRSDLTSSAGACGVLQVMPKWSAFTCKQMRQPLAGVAAGAISWRYWQRRKGVNAAAHYNAGNKPGARAWRYQRAHNASKMTVKLLL